MDKDIEYALSLIEIEIDIKKYRLIKDHLLPKSENILKKEIESLQYAVTKIRKAVK